jgi:hypothetical protein
VSPESSEASGVIVGEKRNDLPGWEVGAHAAGEAGALVDKYYKGAQTCWHRVRVCQIDWRNATAFGDDVDTLRS